MEIESKEPEINIEKPIPFIDSVDPVNLDFLLPITDQPPIVKPQAPTNPSLNQVLQPMYYEQKEAL